jgi:hypothetical protein
MELGKPVNTLLPHGAGNPKQDFQGRSCLWNGTWMPPKNGTMDWWHGLTTGCVVKEDSHQIQVVHCLTQ